MDNIDAEHAVAVSTDAVKHAAEAFQAQAHKAGEQSFAAAKDFGDNVRALLEKSLHETRAGYVKAKGAMEESSAALEASLGATRKGVAEINVKAIEALKADAGAQFDFLSSLVAAKSLSDAITLNTEFVRKRFEDATTRAKSFSELARKVAEETASPIRETVAKTAKFAS